MSSSEIGSLYNELFKQYRILHSQKSGQKAQCDFNAVWAEAKAKHSPQDFMKFAHNLLSEYRQKNSSKKASNILTYFVGKSAPPRLERILETKALSVCSPLATTNKTSSSVARTSLDTSTENAENVVDDPDLIPSATRKRKAHVLKNDEEFVDDPELRDVTVKSIHATPAQDKLRARIALLEAELDVLIRRRDSISADGKEQAEILKLRKIVQSMKKELHKKQQHSVHSKKHRESQKSKLTAICTQNPDVAKALKLREEPGRPRLEESQPELLRTIVELAMFGASAEERRRSEVVRSCRTLGDLHTRLVEQGFNISRSGTYIRLLPRRYNTVEGKRHVSTVPVKLSRPEADHHKAHPDQHFCTSTVRSLETVASILGPNAVSFISQDDKARVPIGLTAANKQAPLLMHVEYRVSLPDHDWVIAAKHKLIPSVYAGCIIKADAMGRPEAVTYSGPTYIAIRSGKHSSSTASSHAVDFKKLTALDIFKDIIQDKTGCVKPVIMISSDGGPDENPRYPKVLANAVQHFIEHNLDALFMFTNAPGRSAFNRVERRMAPLSRELSGVILPHDSFGSHLDGRGRTVDTNLEKNNFCKAGKVLAEIWSNVVIDGKDVVAEYVDPDASKERFVPTMPSQEWCSKHIRQSQYLLQVVKCNDRSCCHEFRSALLHVLPSRFLPLPFPILQSPEGLNIPKPEEHDGKNFAPFLLRQSLGLTPSYNLFRELPYDLYCPSLRSDPGLLAGRTCQECGLYFSSKKAVATHKTSLHKKKKKNSDKGVSEEDNDEDESENIQDPNIIELETDTLPEEENVAFVSVEQSNENPWTVDD